MNYPNTVSLYIIHTFRIFFYQPIPIYTLVIFRVAFGILMFFSIIRFMLKGWVYDLYSKPVFFFTYYGFEWVKPLPLHLMYALMALLALCAIGIAIGFLYRISTVLFFLIFTYLELIDKSNYLNHYYFISLISFLFCLVPANRAFSIDAIRQPDKRSHTIPAWAVLIFKLQICIVYFFAGIAKINHEWLIRAMPLKIWLPAKYDIPFIGSYMDMEWVAYFFSWAGMLFDVLIPFFLWNKKTSSYAYIVVVVFHTLTAILFPVIGMFPYIMMFAAVIFLPSDVHRNIIQTILKIFNYKIQLLPNPSMPLSPHKLITVFFILYFIVQIFIPLRYLAYPGDLFWTEEGYRFSWRVMLMEKAGYAVFSVTDSITGKTVEVKNADYLTPQQEKMMSTQPDMILQYAKFLKKEFENKGYNNPCIRVESYVTLNGCAARQYIRSTENLATISDYKPRSTWLLPYDHSHYNE